jgi:hypothetical protein
MRRRKSGTGSNAAGQAGDIQGLDSPRVEELIEEGQAFEAGVIAGIEDAPDADVAEVTTRQVREDDVPEEYLERDQD